MSDQWQVRDLGPIHSLGRKPTTPKASPGCTRFEAERELHLAAA